MTHLPIRKKAISTKWLNINLMDWLNTTSVVYYFKTFAPVVKMSMVRIIIALAANRKWILHQLDVKNAFLHRNLDEQVYMSMPLSYATYPNSSQVCRLKRAFYDLK